MIGLASRKVLIEPKVVSKSGFKGKKVGSYHFLPGLLLHVYQPEQATKLTRCLFLLPVIHEAELDAGDYVIIPCAFEAGKEGDFVLKSSAGKLRRMRSSKDWKISTLKGKWDAASAGGCKNHKTFKHNPQFPFAVAEKTEAVFMVHQTEKDEFDNLGFYIVKSDSTSSARLLHLCARENVLNNDVGRLVQHLDPLIRCSQRTLSASAPSRAILRVLLLSILSQETTL